jgi:hypothetical protein
MKANNTSPDQGIENKVLWQMLEDALKEAETPQAKIFDKSLGPNEIERPHIPASLKFHYRNHPEMLQLSRNNI